MEDQKHHLSKGWDNPKRCLGCREINRQKLTQQKAITDGSEQTKTCWFFEKGVCQRGDQCPFAHIETPEHKDYIKKTGESDNEEEDGETVSLQLYIDDTSHYSESD